MFDSLGKLVGNMTKVATAPLKAALDVTNAIVEPIADAAETVAKEVKRGTGQD